jgi:hypothetical protein
MLLQAEAADQRNNLQELFRLLKRHAPKVKRERSQLRSEEGFILSPSEEVAELVKYWAEVAGNQALPTQLMESSGDVELGEVREAIASLKTGKAARPQFAPHVLWRLAE